MWAVQVDVILFLLIHLLMHKQLKFQTEIKSTSVYETKKGGWREVIQSAIPTTNRFLLSFMSVTGVRSSLLMFCFNETFKVTTFPFRNINLCREIFLRVDVIQDTEPHL